MRVLLTGGAGDLGQVLTRRLSERGDVPVVLDVRAPGPAQPGTFIHGSVLDRPRLSEWFRGCDAIVHIAAWHGIHEDRGIKHAYDFFDLNVRGTFEVLETAASLGIDRMVHISTTSVRRPDTLYGRSKLAAERLVEDYRRYRALNAIILRPRSFIPFWNHDVYSGFADWARWFCKGAVHIDDVAAAVLLCLDRLAKSCVDDHPPLPLDGAYEYTDGDLAQWDADGPGSTFRKYYTAYFELARAHGIDPTVRPNKLDITETIRWLGYRPTYSMASLLRELATYGDRGPPPFGPPRA